MVAEEQKKSKVKRVWILGAGFSRPLGGPLLADLFTMRGWRRLRQQFPMNFVSGRPGTSYYADDVGIIRILYAVFHYGTGFPEKALFGVPSRSMGESQFEHAEDFIVQLARMSSQELYELTNAALGTEAFLKDDESGVGSVRHNETVGLLLSRYPEEKKDALQRDLLAAAKRLMAFECCAFLCELEQSGETEPYMPYKAWANHLSKDDAIITFNYDLVVEKFVDLDNVSVCRMHGGIGRDGNQNAAEWLNNPGNVPDILIPGKEKEGADKGRHQVHWDRAAKHLESAEHVVFLGYGLPESDAMARSFLLKHLRRNHEPHLTIEIILGEPNFRTQRLEATLKQALAHRVHTEADRIRNRETLQDQDRTVTALKEELGHPPGMLLGTELGGMRNVRDETTLQSLIEQEMHENRAVIDGFKDMTLTVLPQYAQDYMQGFATRQS